MALPSYFRGEQIPTFSPYTKEPIDSKTDAVKYILQKYRYDTPISNWEFVEELKAFRFQDIIFRLRHNEEWEIETVRGKNPGHFVYWLKHHPDDNENYQQTIMMDTPI